MLQFSAPTALPSTTKCAISFWSSSPRSSASILVFRTRPCWHAFGGQARRLFPRRLLWMRPAGLRIRDATRLSPRVTRPVGKGMFLTQDVSTQVGTMALVPQVVDAIKVPVIAAGGIADARGILAAFALGAAAVQIGTAYLC